MTPTVAVELERLAGSVMSVRDLLRDPELTRRLDDGLRAAGYLAFDPVGARFDPTAHAVVDVAPAPEPRLAGTVAATERVGFVRHGVLVRPAEVVVFEPDEGRRP